MSLISESYKGLCLTVAEKAHRGQIRTRGSEKGLPYIVHPKRVSEALTKDSIESLSALLHDVIEDTRDSKKPITIKYLLDIGIPLAVVDMVSVVTRLQGENYFDFIHRISKYSGATRLKIADIEDNMSSLEEGCLKDKYRFALEFLRNSQE